MNRKNTKYEQKVSGVFISSFETYTRYSGVDDEQKKKSLGCFYK